MNIIDRGVNFSSAVVTTLVAGQRLDKKGGDLSSHRLNICKTSGPNGNPCEKYQNGWCSECGCLLKLKVRFPLEKCPIDKWPAIEQPKASEEQAQTTETTQPTKCGGCG